MRDYLSIDWLKVEDFIPVKLFTYPSATRCAMFEDAPGQAPQYLDRFCEHWYNAINNAGLLDNKIVIELKHSKHGFSLFMGWYDGNYSLGLAAAQKDGTEPKELTYNSGDIKQATHE
jgi:hypothetical protein